MVFGVLDIVGRHSASFLTSLQCPCAAETGKLKCHAKIWKAEVRWGAIFLLLVADGKHGSGGVRSFCNRVPGYQSLALWVERLFWRQWWYLDCSDP